MLHAYAGAKTRQRYRSRITTLNHEANVNQSTYSQSYRRAAVRWEVAINSELEALRSVAKRGDRWRQSVVSPKRSSRYSTPPLADHAAPLAPLRDRDQQALSDFFQRDDMREIEADVTQMLLQLWPEPCWEDDPFAFLQDFL